MSISVKRIEANLSAVRSRIASACASRRRNVEDVTLVAVTKTVDVDAIKTLIELGVCDIGESRVAQMLERRREIETWLGGSEFKGQPVRWHLIGHLQRNKVKIAIEAADVIHSVDSLRLADEINGVCEKLRRVARVLMQVNCSNEVQKFGVAVGATVHLGELITTFPNIELMGLMTMAAFSDNPEDARPTFVRLRELFEEMRSEKIATGSFGHLSMGMSQDYPVAIEEGATMIRVGSALFE